MKERVLYQLKLIDKMIFRYFLQEAKEKCPHLCHIPTPTQMQIMDYLLKHKNEEIYQKDLEKILGLRRATVSGVLKTMEKNNLIERMNQSEDARIKKVMLKANAKNFFEETEKSLSELNEVACKGISEQELEIVSEVIKKIQKNLENAIC